MRPVLSRVIERIELGLNHAQGVIGFIADAFHSPIVGLGTRADIDR